MFDIAGNYIHRSCYEWSHGEPPGSSADKCSNDGRCRRLDHGADYIESRRRLVVQRDHSHSTCVRLDRVRGADSSDLSLPCEAYHARRERLLAATTERQVQGRLLLF